MKLPRLTRRRFLLTSAAAVAGVGVYTHWIEPHWVDVVHREMPIRNLPAALDGKTLAQVSDLHVGPAVDPDYLIRTLQYLATLAPDMIAITGDFMSCNGTERVDEVGRVMDHLAIPPLGAFAITGNHDYGNNWSHPAIADRLQARLAERGVTMLRNASRDVSGLQIVGLEDLWSLNWRPNEMLSKLEPEQPSLVLCHNPDAVDRPIWGRAQGWILSGHTHGGQCKPPFLPPPLLPVQNKRYTAGAFDLGDGRTLYINRGLGHLLRVRFNVRPEITLFRLVRA